MRAALPLSDWQQGLLPKVLVARLAGVMVPVPTGLAADLIGSLDHPMTASDPLLRHYVLDPDGGLTSIEDAVAASLSGRSPLPVDVLRTRITWPTATRSGPAGMCCESGRLPPR